MLKPKQYWLKHLKQIKNKQKRKVKTNTEEVVKAAIEGILKKKENDVVRLDLTKIENSVCKYFIICHADSNTQVNALADSVVETVREKI